MSGKMNVFYFFTFFFILNCTEVLCQTCSGAETCQQCYAIPGCAWCAEESDSSVITLDQRCFDPNANNSNKCAVDAVIDEEGSISLDTLNLTGDNQISIQKANIKLRAGDTRSFEVNVRPAENFPLDLYMIVDLSFSLLDDLNTIKSISGDIADTIRNISTRFQIGFGTYVDKLVYPYISEFTLELPFDLAGEPSACRTDNCVAPFSYVHNVNLTNSSTDFIGGFASLGISTNADSPEGTLDAIGQAILCQDIVGWRENARKIIVVITDATVHVAGDGVHAGILEPAPSECLTRFDGEKYTYVENTKYDYPSLEQIRTISESNLVSPVFAVLENVREYYESIADVLSAVGAQVVTIEQNSANIIDALETAYENIVSEVQLSYRVQDDAIRIVNTVLCPDGTNANPDGLSCSNVTTDDTITFTVNVTLLNCTEELANEPRTVDVIIPGYGRFQIVVEGICRCDCEESGLRGPTLCSGNGTQACGVCECDSGWTGENCNCRTDEVDSLTCPTGNSADECNGRGDCLCGECQCRVQGTVTNDPSGDVTLYTVSESLEFTGSAILVNEQPIVYGETCECDNYGCPRNDTGYVCSNQGNCTCSGQCECGRVEYGNLPYTGTNCACNRAFCYNQSIPYSDGLQPCNGRGDCNGCDMENPCNCEPGFVPPFCTVSPASLRSCFGSGSFGRDCVQCIADNDDYLSSCSQCFTVPSTYARADDRVEDLPGSINGTTISCSFTTNDPICEYVYYVALRADSTTNDQRQIIHAEPASCFPLRWWHLALILLVGLLILGIIILVIVKIIFMILDYKEVKYLDKSVAETDLSKNFNPLYQSPEVKYDNVAFGKE